MAKHKKSWIINPLMALAAMLVIVYFFPHPEANQYKYEEGRPWGYAQLIAPFDIPIYPDSLTVKRVRDSLDQAFVPVFSRDPQAVTAVIEGLTAAWHNSDADGEPSTRDNDLRRKTLQFVRQAYARDIIDDDFGKRIAAGSLPTVKVIKDNTVSSEMTAQVSAVSDVVSRLQQELEDPTAIAWVNQNKIRDYLQPNLVYDEAVSRQLYDNDLVRYTAVKGVIQQGQTIIDKGTVITSQDYTNLVTYERMMQEQNEQQHQSRWLMWMGQLLYVTMVIVALCAYLYFSAPKVWANFRSMLFVMLLLTLFFLLGVGLQWIFDGAVYVVPFAIVPILMIVFFDAPTALAVTLATVLLSAGIVAFPLEFIFLQMMGAVGAVYSLTELTRRSQLLRTSGVVLGCYLVGYLAMELMMNSSFDGFSWVMVVYLVVSAVLSSMVYILMVAIERIFGFVSVVTLIELSDTNNPILRQLSQDCPGTFQHSMSVATLAADAAQKIGANEQLVRAGAMYHDIGKIINPNFYTENQRGVNPHDALPVEKSAEIIIGHVTDGLRLADREKLPTVLKDFIREHHGAGKAKYFYYTYCNAHPGEQVDPRPFTYPGPNPRSIESSILMMADSVEAASRSLKDYSQQSLRTLIDKIIDGQIAEGLHNNSPLSFADVSRIKSAFERRLMTMYHARVAYPDAPKK